MQLVTDTGPAMRNTFARCVLALLLAGTGLRAVDPAPAPKFDTKTVTTFEATVLEMRDTGKEMTLQVRTESESSLTVYLGPREFVKSFEITFNKGDRIHITGSKVKFEGENLVLAREVRKDSTTLYLRGKDGAPYWT
jgi:hypothetical protein